jgi:uncharacterized protein
MFAPFSDAAAEPHIRGFLHDPQQPNGDAIVLTHGAGANCQSKLLVAMSDALADAGFLVLRFDLPFRTERRFGPPSPGNAARDREGLRRAILLMKERQSNAQSDVKKKKEDLTSRRHARIFVGGHSYGGRQATMLAAEDPGLVDGLLLLSYPLHPPRKPEQLRTSHFPKITTRALFVHGTRDPFATIEEMEAALKLIPGQHTLFHIEGAGHDLLGKKPGDELAARVVLEFQAFLKR